MERFVSNQTNSRGVLVANLSVSQGTNGAGVNRAKGYLSVYLQLPVTGVEAGWVALPGTLSNKPKNIPTVGPSVG